MDECEKALEVYWNEEEERFKAESIRLYGVRIPQYSHEKIPSSLRKDFRAGWDAAMKKKSKNYKKVVGRDCSIR